ncbi:MAG TPA: glycerol-3-phosphate 1-O-acyltransferase PlsY [Alteraurantiacibacter sp.]
MEHFFAALTGYLIGSIPFGLVLTRAAGLGDVRNIGSGNIGATNVLRTGRKGLAAATLMLDLGKGLAAVLLVRHFWPEAVAWAALAAVVGHCFPVWLKFKGGKGVATNAGVAFGLAWPIGLAYALVWLGVLGLTRISSLAGMSAVLAAVIMASLGGWPEFLPVLLAIAALVIWLHRENLKRLREGTEPRLGGKK